MSNSQQSSSEQRLTHIGVGTNCAGLAVFTGTTRDFVCPHMLCLTMKMYSFPFLIRELSEMREINLVNVN